MRLLSSMERGLRGIWNDLSVGNGCLQMVADNLGALQKFFTTSIYSTTEIPAEVIRYVFTTRGKRLRPAVFFLICKMLGYRGKHLIPMGAVCEYVHTASLLHDDVVDDTTLRRQRPTVRSKWGDETSILVGDLIYAHASELMTHTDNMRIVSSFARAIRLMSEGELLQLENLYNLEIGEETWMRIIRYKTSELLSASCRTAALLAGCEHKQQECLAEFGTSIGIAFQLIDDALDFCGEERNLGKPPLTDLTTGRITLPLILLYQHGDDLMKETLRQIVAVPPPSLPDLQHVQELVTRHGTLAQTTAKAAEFTQKAVACLDLFPDSAAKHNLVELTNLLLSRVK